MTPALFLEGMVHSSVFLNVSFDGRHRPLLNGQAVCVSEGVNGKDGDLHCNDRSVGGRTDR
jgi:hypothetical protein